MKNQEYIIFMYPKNEFTRIEETIDKLSKTKLNDNLQFRYFSKRFKEQFHREANKTYSIEEAAVIVEKAERTIYRYIKSGKLYAYKVHGEWRIPEDKLTEFVLEKRPGYFFPNCG